MSLWKHRLRVTVFDESSFSELRVFRGTPRQWFVWLIVVFLLVVGLTYLLVARTRLRERLVPGYLSEQSQTELQETRALADTLSVILIQQERALTSLRHAMVGDSAALAFLKDAGISPAPNDSAMLAVLDSSLFLPGDHELELRNAVEGQDRFALQQRSANAAATQTGFNFPPIIGGLSAAMDLGRGHLGVDLVAPSESVIQAVDAGVVLFGTYTAETGYTLLIQHRGERVSVYKHCASLLKRPGDMVQGGEAVALVGNTGELSSGPHLHFEWWVQGRPVDPRPWLGSDLSNGETAP